MSKPKSLKKFKAKAKKDGYIILEGVKEKFSKEMFEEMPDEIWRIYARTFWREQKAVNRSSRCSVRGKNGNSVRCPGENKCNECPYVAKDSQGNPQPGKRTGNLLSLEAFDEMGIGIPGFFKVETQVEERELARIIHKALADLSDEEYHIALLWMGGMPERDIAKRVAMSQRGVGYRKHKIFTQLKETLKNFR